MSAESDLTRLVRGMRPRLHGQQMVFVTVAPDAVPTDAVAREAVVRVVEDEGVTLVLPLTTATAAGLVGEFPCARITLDIRSALEAVGFLAVVTRALAGAGISANPVSGFHHDHVFVPWPHRHRALAVLEALARDGG